MLPEPVWERETKRTGLLTLTLGAVGAMFRIWRRSRRERVDLGEACRRELADLESTLTPQEKEELRVRQERHVPSADARR